jgi:hypothetical protein
MYTVRFSASKMSVICTAQLSFGIVLNRLVPIGHAMKKCVTRNEHMAFLFTVLFAYVKDTSAFEQIHEALVAVLPKHFC